MQQFTHPKTQNPLVFDKTEHFKKVVQIMASGKIKQKTNTNVHRVVQQQTYKHSFSGFILNAEGMLKFILQALVCHMLYAVNRA